MLDLLQNAKERNQAGSLMVFQTHKRRFLLWLLRSLKLSGTKPAYKNKREPELYDISEKGKNMYKIIDQLDNSRLFTERENKIDERLSVIQ